MTHNIYTDPKPSDFGIERLLEPEEIDRLTVAEYREYERKLRNYRDWKNTIDTEKKISWEEGHEVGKEEGREEGMKEGMEKGMEEGKKQNAIEMAKILKEKGVAIDIIAESSGLTEEQINAL